MLKVKVKAFFPLYVTLVVLLSGCVQHPIRRIHSQPNGFLLSDSMLILEDRMEHLSVLFNNGLVLFASRDIIEKPELFADNNVYDCRYCWGKYQYHNQIITVFKPRPVGYLNLPGSYPVEQLKYQVIDGRITNVSGFNSQITVQKTKLFINPDRAWLATIDSK